MYSSIEHFFARSSPRFNSQFHKKPKTKQQNGCIILALTVINKNKQTNQQQKVRQITNCSSWELMTLRNLRAGKSSLASSDLSKAPLIKVEAYWICAPFRTAQEKLSHAKGEGKMWDLNINSRQSTWKKTDGEKKTALRIKLTSKL